jgi:hypothetical protein
VLPVDEEVLDLALASSFTDLEDAIQYYTALAHDLAALVTRSKRDYRNVQMLIVDAQECVELFAASR